MERQWVLVSVLLNKRWDQLSWQFAFCSVPNPYVRVKIKSFSFLVIMNAKIKLKLNLFQFNKTIGICSYSFPCIFATSKALLAHHHNVLQAKTNVGATDYLEQNRQTRYVVYHGSSSVSLPLKGRLVSSHLS